MLLGQFTLSLHVKHQITAVDVFNNEEETLFEDLELFQNKRITDGV